MLYLLAAAVLAACSLSYELIFAQVIAEITGNATIWESISVATFLCGMGVRSLVFRNEDSEKLAARLVMTELGLISGAMLSFFGIILCQMLYRMYVYDGGTIRELWSFPPVFLLGAVAQVAPLLLGWLTAYELQFFLHWPMAPAFRFKESAVLASYHFGALAGTLGFVAARRMGAEPFAMLLATIAVNLLFVAGVLQIFGTWRTFARVFAMMLVLLGLGIWLEPGLAQLALKNHYYNVFSWRFDSTGLKDVQHPSSPGEFLAAAPELPEVRRKRSPFQVLDMVRDKESEPNSLYINGRFQVGSGSAARYHQAFAHVSLGYKLGPARRVLILGGGDGVLAAELIERGDVEAIDLVEIDQEVLDLADQDPDLVRLNAHALRNDRVSVFREDAMAFVRRQRATYDAVFIDLTYPYDFDSARFFCVEFFRMIARDLVPQGILVAGLPVDLVDAEDPTFGRAVHATLAAAGFGRIATYTNGHDHFMVVGKDELKETWTMDPGLRADELTHGKIKTSPTTAPETTGEVLTVMRPRLLMTHDTFY